MKTIIATWLMGCVALVACVFFLAEGYYLFAAIDAALCWLFYVANRRAIKRWETEVTRG